MYRENLSVRARADPNAKLSDEQLLAFLIAQNVSHRGTDVRLDHGVPFAAADFCRKSIDPTLWHWKVLQSHKWKRSGHITQLEAVAVLDLVKRLVRNDAHVNMKCVLLVDNQAVIGIATKGRTSSVLLQGPLRRISAVLLAGNLRLLFGYVKSEWNPADGPSRWVSKRALADA